MFNCFISAKTMNLLKRNLVTSGSVIAAFVDYLVAKGVDVKDYAFDENQHYGEGKYKTNSQQKWEDFAALVQYTEHTRLMLKKSKFDLIDTLVKAKIDAVKNAVKDKIEFVQDVTRAKLDAAGEVVNDIQDSFQHFSSRK